MKTLYVNMVNEDTFGKLILKCLRDGMFWWCLE